jgi:hypothetical protein
MLAFTLCCYAACFPPSDPLADLLYGMPSKEKAEAYSTVAWRRLRKIAAIPNVHHYVHASLPRGDCVDQALYGQRH